MKYIDRSKVIEPAILQGQTPPTSGDAIDETIYGHTDVKKALTDLQQGICCYCESRYDVTGYGEVEHFRPKNGWKQDKNDKKLNKPGYYWLAYKWENLMYACKRCNCKYKKNNFPLKDPAKRFDPNVRDISQEEPLLINPYEEQHPENHLTFAGNTIKALTNKGQTSIMYYGLDREELNEERQGIINIVDALVKLAQLNHDKEAEMQSKLVLTKFLQNKLAEGQHTLMIRCNFGKYL